MKNNTNKKIFLLLTVIFLLVALTTVNASNTNQTSNTEKNHQTIQQEKNQPQTQTLQLTQKEKTNTTNNENKTRKKPKTQHEQNIKTQTEKIHEKKVNTITINNIENISIGNPTTITGRVIDEDNITYNGNIKIKITDNNEETQYQNEFLLENGKINFTFKAKKASQHKLYLSIEENEYYKETSKIMDFNVEKARFFLNFKDKTESTVLENISISANLVNQYNNPMENITIKIQTDNETLATPTTDKNGNINFTQYKFQQTNEDEYITIYLDIDEDENHEAFHLESYYYLKKRDVQIIMDKPESVKINDTIQLKGKVIDTLSSTTIPYGIVNIKINGQQIITEIPLDNQGNFTTNTTITLDNIGKTKLQIEASYIPENPQIYHTSKMKSFEIFIETITTNISIKSSDTRVNQNNNISIELKDEFNNNLNETITLTISNPEDVIVYNNNLQLSNGTVTFIFTPKQEGIYSLYARYDSKENIYKKSTRQFEIHAKKDTPHIHLKEITNVTYSVEKLIEGQLTNSLNQPINNTPLTITISDNKYTLLTDNNGTFRKILDNFRAGINYLNINTSETDNLYSAAINVSFMVKRQTSKIIMEENTRIHPGDNLTIKGQLLDANNNPIKNGLISIRLNNESYNITTLENGQFNKTITNIKGGRYNINLTFNNTNYEESYANIVLNVTKISVNLIVENTRSTLGEDITFRARLMDEYGNNVTGGNLVFKANGISLRTDNSFHANVSTIRKLPVTDGSVWISIKSEKYFTYLKNITASYSGSYRYESAKSDTANISVKLREATIQVTTSRNIIKQHENIIFTAKITDKTSLNPINQGKVFFKLNDITLRDDNGNVIYVPVENSTAIYNYSPKIMASVDKDNKLRNYTFTVIYVNPDYYPTIRNTTNFSMEKSTISINISSVILRGTSLNLKATFRDYMGYHITGENKVCIKINGVTYKENKENKYYKINDGILDITCNNLGKINIRNVEIVTGQRQAYHASRIMTNTILREKIVGR